jgi:hypothetical protein
MRAICPVHLILLDSITLVIFGEASHIPNFISNFPLPRSFQRIRPLLRPYVTFRNKLILYDEELLVPIPSFKLEDTHFRLSATAYAIYSQLSSMFGGRLLHPQLEEEPCRGNRDPHNMVPRVKEVIQKNVELCYRLLGVLV